MTQLRIADCARLLGVSDDTVRRWIDAGRLTAGEDAAGRLVVDGAELATLLQAQHQEAVTLDVGPTAVASARNRFTGLVTRVVRDGVMAQVELAAGPFRVVSLMSREAADELRLEPGELAVASVKSTNVVIERPARA